MLSQRSGEGNRSRYVTRETKFYKVIDTVDRMNEGHH
jgi:hypothetical protein